MNRLRSVLLSGPNTLSLSSEVGLLTRPAAFFILMTMLTAAFIRHADDPFSGAEKAYLFASVAFMFLTTGAGRLSVDGLLRRNR